MLLTPTWASGDHVQLGQSAPKLYKFYIRNPLCERSFVCIYKKFFIDFVYKNINSLPSCMCTEFES
jgi:hypothetical protein